MPWSSSDRRSRLPADWEKRRAAVKRRADGQCEAKQHEPNCNGVGTECDHVVAGDDHRLANLQWLSGPCHRAKTKREAQAAKAAQRAVRRRPPEPHPGIKP